MMHIWESREGCREDVAAQIPAECLTCMVVPVFSVSCLDLTPIIDFHLLHSKSYCISCHSSTFTSVQCCMGQSVLVCKAHSALE